MPAREFNCLPTIIGSLPHTDAKKACALIARHLREIPAWPQLPRRSFRENMCVQYSEGFPGAVIEGERLYVDSARDLQKPLEALYAAYLENNVDSFPISAEYAAGLHAFLAQPNLSPTAVKGHVTGPLTWGMTVTDKNGRAIIHDEVLGDAVPKLLRLKAGWQERELGKISKNTIVFVDEPYMAAYGSSASAGAFASADKIVGLLDEVFGGISGLKGLHCCGNTDWSVLLRAKLDILSFDAYNYAASLSLYPAEIKKFMARGGVIAWGIVPNDGEALAKESASSLKDRLEEAMAPFTRNGLGFKDLIGRGLLTPSCGLALLSEETAERALELLAELSARIRKRYA